MSNLIQYLKTKSGIVGALFLAFVIVGIIVGVYLVRQRQQTTSQATVSPVSFVSGGCVEGGDGNPKATCPQVQIQIISPIEISPSCPAEASSSPSPQISSSPVAQESASGSATPSPTPASCNRLVYYKFSETAGGLSSAAETLLTTSPLVINYTFQDATPGEKTVFVEFRDSLGGTTRESAKIIFQASSSSSPASTPSLSPSPSSASPSASLSPSTSPSVSPSPSPTPTPSQTTQSSSPSASASSSGDIGGPNDVLYRLAETEAGLAAASYKVYSQVPTNTNFILANENPGIKQVWVEFKNNATGETRKEHINVKLINPPAIQTADCTLDINRQNLKVSIAGLGFGDGRGKFKSGATELDILDWKDNKVTGILKNPDLTGGNNTTFQFSLARQDGVLLENPIICKVDTSMVALGARVFCRDQGKFDIPNVNIILTDENNNRTEETVTIASDGTITGLKTQFQVGKPYAISIKVPYSLRTNGQFIAGSGTSFVSVDTGQSFILPIGDTAPVILQDGKINTLDRSELLRQWSVLGTNVATRSGDFNQDSKVNSIDWACMRYDFNKEEQPLPVVTLPSPSPSPSASALPSSSATTSVSPSPSGQRAAYFLPLPVGSGTYPLNSQFALDVNIWSQNEAANLFKAQLSFSPAALEVLRIDKGTTLTNWTDSSFNNTTGKISLIAGLPNPGLKTTEGNNPLMAKIIFKGKQAGSATVTMASGSAIYSNTDNANIISGLISAPLVISQ